MGSILAILGKSGFALATRLLTQAFIERVAARVVLYLLRKLADYTTNDLDNRLVDDVEDVLKGVIQ